MTAWVQCSLNEPPFTALEKALLPFSGRVGKLTFVWLGAGAALGGQTYLQPVTGEGGGKWGIEHNPSASGGVTADTIAWHTSRTPKSSLCAPRTLPGDRGSVTRFPRACWPRGPDPQSSPGSFALFIST